MGVRGLPTRALPRSGKGGRTGRGGGLAHGVHPGADVGDAEHDALAEAVGAGAFAVGAPVVDGGDGHAEVVGEFVDVQERFQAVRAGLVLIHPSSLEGQMTGSVLPPCSPVELPAARHANQRLQLRRRCSNGAGEVPMQFLRHARRCRFCRLNRPTCTAVAASGCRLLKASADEEDNADRAHDEELERAPAEQEHEEVQPAGTAVLDQGEAVVRGEEVRRGEEHRGGAPFQAAAGADRVERDVGGHVAPQVVAGVGAERPEQPDHGVSSRGTVRCRDSA